MYRDIQRLDIRCKVRSIMITLRPYQQEAVDAIRDRFREGKKHLIVCAPTGAGKTVIFSYLTQAAKNRNNKVLILTDRMELLTQADGSLTNFGVTAQTITAGTNFIEYERNVYIGMLQTLRNRVKNKLWRRWIDRDIDLIIIDEAHSQNSNYIHESGLLESKHVLGFTATPMRRGKQRQLGLDYDDIVNTVTVSDLINQGYLVPDDYFGVQSVDVKDLKYDSMKGDYSESQMFDKFNSAKLYSGVVKNWKKHAIDTKTICFCVNIPHVIKTVKEFQKNGIDARFVVSGMSEPKQPKDGSDAGKVAVYEARKEIYDEYVNAYLHYSGDRDTVIQKFRNGEFPVLVNAGILTTGFDVPDIETVIVNRATMSRSLWLQMIGRGSRTYSGKTHFNVLDFGGNAERLGSYTANQSWSLWHDYKKNSGGVAPVKICGKDSKGIDLRKDAEGCERMILATYKICPFCGYKYPEKKAKEAELDAVAYVDGKAKKFKPIKEMSDYELWDYSKFKRHKPAWFWRQLYFRGGIDRIREFGERNGWKYGTIQKAVEYCEMF